MAYVLTQPQVMATAAADVAAIGSTINEATAATGRQDNRCGGGGRR